MRILFTTIPAMGHFHPLVPLAKAAQKAGHEVAFASSRSIGSQIEASGFTSFSTDDSSAEVDRTSVVERVLQLPVGTRSLLASIEVFIGMSAKALPNLLELCKRWQPDLIVREEYEFSGAVAAESLGLPHAAVQVTYSANWQTSLGSEFASFATNHLDKVRALGGLPSDPNLEMLYRHLFLSFDPPSLLDPNVIMPATTGYVRTETFDRSSQEMLPDYLTKPFDHPLMYVTLGTEAPHLPHIFPRVYQTILEGLHDEPGTVVLTVGRKRDPLELGPHPANVHLERYIPQSLLLPHCDVVVTHGGHNTILAALNLGLPLVFTPFFADQFPNARRCVELGVGQMLTKDELTPENVQRAVREVLRDKRYRENAQRIQAEIQAMPGLGHGVELLETLVEKKHETKIPVYS
jgi:UDP:flavonoid glycosyltransferase YjiC (YdhE family)